MQVYKYNQMSCDLDLFSWASREVTCILKHHKWCTVSCKSSTFRSHESLSTLMATSIYDGFHKISGVNFKLCACLIPADSWGKIVSWDTCWTLDDPFRTAKVWKIEILFRHQGAQGAVTLPQKNKIRRQDFKLVNLGNWLEDIEDMWDLYSYVDCQCHYILLQCIFFLLNIYIYICINHIISIHSWIMISPSSLIIILLLLSSSSIIFSFWSFINSRHKKAVHFFQICIKRAHNTPPPPNCV